MNDFPSRVKCTKYMVDQNITHLQSQLQQSGLIPHNSTSISNRGENGQLHQNFCMQCTLSAGELCFKKA